MTTTDIWRKGLTGPQRRLLVRRWETFSPLSVESSNLADPLTVEAFIERAALWRDLDEARLAYLQTLVATGLLEPAATLPGDDFLWEMHPCNIQSEQEHAR